MLLDELADLLRAHPEPRPRGARRGAGPLADAAARGRPALLDRVGRPCSATSRRAPPPGPPRSWQESLAHLGQPDAIVEELDRGFRVPAAVIDFAARLLPSIAPDLRPPSSVRDDPGTLHLTRTDTATDLWPALLGAVTDALGHEGSIGVIVPDTWTAKVAATLTAAGIDHLLPGTHSPSDGAAETLLDAALGEENTPLPRVSVVPATTAKGLEYDYVIVLEPAAIAAAEPDTRTGLRRLYVVLTRAVSGLTVVHHEGLPAELRR